MLGRTTLTIALGLVAMGTFAPVTAAQTPGTEEQGTAAGEEPADGEDAAGGEDSADGEDAAGGADGPAGEDSGSSGEETGQAPSPEQAAEQAGADGDQDGSDSGDPQDAELGRMSDEQALLEEQHGVEKEPSTLDPHEEPDEDYYFLGAFYRHTWTLDSVIEVFVDEAPKANNPGAGLEFTYRRGGFDIITRLYWQNAAVQGPFRADGDPQTDTEIIDSSLQTVMASVTFLWGTAFNDIVSLQYGMGLGVGVTLGDLNRTEAYPTSDGWAKCDRAGDPEDPGSFCGPVNEAEDFREATATKPKSNLDGADGEHYDINARRWTDGGSVPNFWFRAAPQLALRIKPIRQLMIRIDGGYDLFSGFFLGGTIAYGL
jgi:hypothetical protein